MKKALSIQMGLLAVVIIIGAIFKGNLSSDALRALHKIAGMLAGLAAIASVIVAFKAKAKPVTKVLLLLAVLTTFMAGVAGKAAASGKGNYGTSFNRMRMFAVVSVAITAGAYFTVDTAKHAAKKQVESEDKQD